MSSLGDRHPGDELLLRYSDGEVSSSESAAVRRHLADCWQCRADLEALERTIGECVRYKTTVLEPCLPAPPAPWFDIYARFDEIDAGEKRFGFAARVLDNLRSFLTARQWIPVAAVLALAVLVHATIQLGLWNSRPRQAPPPGRREAVKSAAIPDLPPDAPAPAVEKRAVVQPPHALQPERRAPTPGDELQVWAALHRLGADLGDPVEVTRSREEVVVSGVGIAPERQQQIRGELGSLPRVAIRFLEPSAESAGAEIYGPAGLSVSAPVSRAQLDLEKQLGGRPAFEQFANRMLETSEALMSRAHALRRLSQRFPVPVEEQMNPVEREGLKSLCREHSGVLLRLVREAQERMEPVLHAGRAAGLPTRPGSAPSASLAWQDMTEELFNETRRFETLLVALLGGTAAESQPRDLPADVMAAAARLRMRAESYDRLAASR